VLAVREDEGADRAHRADQATVLGGEERLRGILDDRNAMMRGNPSDAGHVARVAEQVCRDDGTGARADARGDRVRGDVEADRVDVGENRDGLLVENRRDGTQGGNRRGDDLVSGSTWIAAIAV
jgi:hypothetical protein